MRKLKQKVENVKYKMGRIPKSTPGYKGQVVMIEDFVANEIFPVVLFVAMSTSLPEMKVVYPTVYDKSDGVGYAETVTLLKNHSGTWVKNVSVEFERRGRRMVGARGVVEEVELDSRDIIVISQSEETLCEQAAKKAQTTRKVVA